MTCIQYLRALALARAFGHEWGRWLEESDQPATVEDIERLARERHNAGPGHRMWDGRCPADCGIMAPTVQVAVSPYTQFEYETVVHTTVSSRLAWEILPGGDVFFFISRPLQPLVLTGCVAGPDAPGKRVEAWAEGVGDYHEPFHHRHVDALREALMALVPVDVADAALADVRAQALPDEALATQGYY